MKKTPIKRVNRKRRQKRWLEQYHSPAFVRWIWAHACVACGHYPSTCAHVTSRGAGGTWRDIVPLCVRCHGEQHVIGIESFERRHAIDLQAEARRINAEWEG